MACLLVYLDRIREVREVNANLDNKTSHHQLM
jgi:hypothetical protein